MIQLDLADAGIPFRTDEGQLDFHGLRHQFISSLVRSGVSVKEARTLARHSSVTLTLDRYSHVGMFDLATAVGKIPALVPAAEPQTLALTGTDSAYGPQYCPTDGISCFSVRAIETTKEPSTVEAGM